MRTEAPYFLLYDSDCRVCTAFARAVAFLDVRRGLQIRPIQDSHALLPGFPGDSALRAAHAVSPDGNVTTGADAMPALIGAVLGIPRIEGWLRGSGLPMSLVNRGYGILVDVRGRLTCGVPAPASAARSPR